MSGPRYAVVGLRRPAFSSTPRPWRFRAARGHGGPPGLLRFRSLLLLSGFTTRARVKCWRRCRRAERRLRAGLHVLS